MMMMKKKKTHQAAKRRRKGRRSRRKRGERKKEKVKKSAPTALLDRASLANWWHDPTSKTLEAMKSKKKNFVFWIFENLKKLH